MDYWADTGKEEISLCEIFSDTGLDKLNWEFRQKDSWLEYQDKTDCAHEFYYAIDLITDLAALILECKMSGSVNLCELYGSNLDAASNVRITATHEELEKMNTALADFVSEPLAYDLSEMCPEEDMRKMAKLCEELRKELFA